MTLPFGSRSVQSERTAVPFCEVSSIVPMRSSLAV
jgi:hypothetical protein